MPLPKGTRFRVKTMPSGKKVRLAFRKGTNAVIETKNLRTGATHTMAEFAKERQRKRRPLRMRT